MSKIQILEDEGPAISGVKTLEEVKKVVKKTPPIPMSLMTSAITRILIEEHCREAEITTDILSEARLVKPRKEMVSARSYVLTIEAGKYSLSGSRQRLQHVTVKAWSRDPQYSDIGIEMVQAAIKKWCRIREIGFLETDEEVGLNFIALRGFYYTLVSGTEAMF